MNNNIQVTCSIINGTSKMKRPTLKNIENTIVHILTSEINYLSPSDRSLSIYVEGTVTTKNNIVLFIEITPQYIDINDKRNHNTLHKSILFSTEIPLDSLLEVLKKEVSWVLEYFGLTIMYITKSFKHIKIEKKGKGYTLEYTS